MYSKGRRKTFKPSAHGTSPATAMVMAVIRILVPLALIAIIAAWVLSYRGAGIGSVRVTTTIPGADIFVAGTMTGFQSDTTLIDVPSGRQIITVRKQGYVSDPEVVVVDVKQHGIAHAAFVLRDARSLARTDSIPPLRSVRQEIFSTGEPIRSVPPAFYRGPGKRYLDFSSGDEDVSARGTTTIDAGTISTTSVDNAVTSSRTSIDSVVDPYSTTQVTVSSTPDGAQITVNGTATSRLTPYTFRGLEQGMYVFRLAKPGYICQPDSIIVTLSSPSQTELAVFDLAADQDIKKPTLTVVTSPPAAGIRIDGRQAGVGKAITDVDYGSHRIEFGEAPGYHTPASTTVDVTADNPNPEITGTYERVAGNSYLAVMPGEENGGKFEGSKLRVFVDNELLLDGPKEKFDAMLLSRIQSGKRLIRVEYDNLADDIHVNMQDGDVSEVTFRIESFFSKRKLRLRERDSMPLDKWEAKSRRLTVLSAS